MRRIIVALALLASVATGATPCSGGLAGTYPCDLVDLRTFVPKGALTGQNSNDCWGWTDPLTRNEYAIQCVRDGTTFVDITDPDNPIYVGLLPTHTSNSSWRDAKTYADHVFVGSEASNHGMQIFDLTQLRSVVAPPAVFSNTAHYNGFGNSHNLVINEDTGFAYAVGTGSCSQGLHMIDISTPTSPTFVGCVSGDGYTHDAQVVVYKGPQQAYQGQEIAFAYNEDTVTIWDVTVKSLPVQLSRTGYAGSEYTHQGWLTDDHGYLLLGDELDEVRAGHNTRIRMWNLTDLTAPFVIGFWDGPTRAIDHNLYVKGNFAYLSNYRSGVRVLDISGIAAGVLNEVGYFDVYPSSNSANFNGTWSTYPYFDSDIFIASGIEQGMFVLEPDVSLLESRCEVTVPLAGAAVAGDVALTWKGIDPHGDALTSTFDVSLDGGVTYTLATPAMSSPTANPDPTRPTPFVDQQFVWDSRADGAGSSGEEIVFIRVTVDDGVSPRVCTEIMRVDNLPSCTITSPVGGSTVAGEVDIVFAGGHPAGAPITSSFDFSMDGGVTFTAATAAASSSVANPDPMRSTPFAGQTFRWDTPADGLGLVGPDLAILRVVVDDGVLASECSVGGLQIWNQPSCDIVAPSPGVMIAGDLDILFGGTDPTNDPLTSTFQFSLDSGATWLMATPAPTSPLANPDPMRATPFFATTFTWDTTADAVGTGGPQNVDFRIVTDDGLASNTCSLGLLLADNLPSCLLVFPPPGAAVSRDVFMQFDGADPSDDALTSTLEFSTDGGVTFGLATPAGSSPTVNPDPLRATPFSGVIFVWDSQGDGVGLVGSESVTFRVRVDDGGSMATCGQVWQLNNQPSCAITSPAPGAAVTRDMVIVFDATDPSSDALGSSFEFSTDLGATWTLATAAPSSPTANPDPPRPSPFSGLVFHWDSQADGVGLGGPQSTLFRVSADDGAGTGICAVDVAVDNQPTCLINFPIASTIASGETPVDFNGSDPSNDPVTSTFEWSTDGGATFNLATTAAGSPLSNPDAGRPTPFVSSVYIWDSQADAIGTFPAQFVDFRITVDDGAATSSCQVMFEVDNVPPPPMCAITLPVGVAMEDVSIGVDASSLSSSTADVFLEYSLDGGTSWATCTMSMASPNPNPATGLPVGLSSYVWDSRGDSVGVAVAAMGVIVRATIDDGVSPLAGECSGVFDVDNTRLCYTLCGDCNTNLLGPDILDSLEAARIAAGLIVPTLLQQGCCDVDSSGTINVLDSLLIAQSAAGLPIALVCP